MYFSHSFNSSRSTHFSLETRFFPRSKFCWSFFGRVPLIDRQLQSPDQKPGAGDPKNWKWTFDLHSSSTSHCHNAFIIHNSYLSSGTANKRHERAEKSQKVAKKSSFDKLLVARCIRAAEDATKTWRSVLCKKSDRWRARIRRGADKRETSSRRESRRTSVVQPALVSCWSLPSAALVIDRSRFGLNLTLLLRLAHNSHAKSLLWTQTTAQIIICTPKQESFP